MAPTIILNDRHFLIFSNLTPQFFNMATSSVLLNET